MKWMSNRLRTIFWCMTLGAITLGFLSVVVGVGHPMIQAGEVQAQEKARAVVDAAAAPRDNKLATESHKNPTGCNEAMDALALCTLPGNIGKQTRRIHHEEAGLDHPSFNRAPEMPVSKTTVDAAKVPVEAPFPWLPVIAFSLAVAGALLGAFNLCMMSLREGGEGAVRRVMARSLELLGHGGDFKAVAVKKSATAAVAKERLLQYRT